MRKKFKFIVALFCIILSIKGFSQSGIYLFSANIPGENVPGIHNGESLITSFSRNYSVNFSMGTTGGPGLIGPATNGGLTILKPFNKSSIILKEKLWAGTNLPNVEIRFYNSINVLYYKVILKTVFITDIIESGELCQTGCPGVTEQIKFNFTKVEERDYTASASNPVIRCWNFRTATNTCN